MQMNSNLGMFCFLNNITFHGVGIDAFFREGFGSGRLEEFMTQIGEHLKAGIQEGFVKPIQRTIFQHDQVEKAFRYMASGQHIGKVLIQMRQEINEKNDKKTGEVQCDTLTSGPSMRAYCKTWFHPDKVYIIAGGLGGVGLELLYYMVLQGARKFVVTSRSGVKSAFQRVFLSRFQMIEQFCSEYKIVIDIQRQNVATISGAKAIFERAQELGTQIGGVFNLTLVLEDGLFRKQNSETFSRVCEPKAIGTANLDRLSRETLNYNLEHFVVFSSLSSGRGNAGQTNYAYANSVMERIIEQRNRDGLSGIAIQFGPIGDVGIVAEQFYRANKKTESDSTDQSESDSKENENSSDNKSNSKDKSNNSLTSEDTIRHVFGLELQRINSCLDVLDRLLPLRMGIYSSYVKFVKASATSGGDSEVIRQLCAYLNIDKRSDDDCLGDIGLDSLSAIEIQQRLDNDFGISITLDDVRKITVKELKNFRDGDRHNLKQYSEDIAKARKNLSRICFTIPTSETVLLNSCSSQSQQIALENKQTIKCSSIYALPPLQGIYDWISNSISKLDRPVIGLNWTKKTSQKCQTLSAVIEYYRNILENLIENQTASIVCEDDKSECKEKQKKKQTCDLLVTPFGGFIACLLAKKGTLVGKIRNLILLDLWPIELEDMDDESKISDYKVRLIFSNIASLIPTRICQQSLKEILALNCERERIAKTIELMRKCVGAELRGEDLTEIVTNSYFRAELLLRYHFKKLRQSKPNLKQSLLKILAKNEHLTIHCIRLDWIASSDDINVNKNDVTQRENNAKKKLTRMFDLESADWQNIEEHIKERVHLHSIRGTQEEITTGKLDSEIEEFLKKIVL